MSDSVKQVSTAPWFVHRRRVAFYETDAMGVVHHANHLRYFEDARVEWMRAHDLIDLHVPRGPFIFAVVELSNRYAKTLKFDDEIETWIQARMEGARIHFQYAIWCRRTGEVAASGATQLVPVDSALRPTRLPKHAREVFDRSPWSVDWPPVAPSNS